jgi:hypothetical protein
MKKFYVLLLSLLFSWEMFAQITIQGIPRNDINTVQFHSSKSAKELSLNADESFSFDDIQYWVGEGSNQAALVVQWNDGKNPDALVWGYKWEGTAYGIDMIEAIAKIDPRFYILKYSGTAYGTAIGGLGFDIDQKKTVALILDGDPTYPKYPEEGIVTTSSYNFDNWTAFDSNDHWQSGWNSKGYWSYWVKEDGGNFVVTEKNSDCN